VKDKQNKEGWVSEIPTDDYKNNLEEDGYRKVSIAYNDKEPIEKWILNTNAPLKDNYFMFKCDGDTEMFALIEEEDLPTPEFYFREDEDEEYTDEEYATMSKEKEDPYFHWYLHMFRIHCREKGMDDSCRYYTEWIKDHKNDSEYVPTTIYVKDGGYAPTPTVDENGEYIEVDEYVGDRTELPF